jgi:hypothetical protein
MEKKLRIVEHKKYLELLLGQVDEEQKHRETMAHAGVTVQLALAAGIISVDHWPPTWAFHSKCLVGACFVAVWLLIHVFVRWQLRLRRGAMVKCHAVLETLNNWVYTDPTEVDLVREPEKDAGSFWATWCDFLFPFKQATRHEKEKRGFPMALVKEMEKAEQRRSGAVGVEWLLFFASLSMLGICLWRTFNANP